MPSIFLRGTEMFENLSVNDRGLNYGDGLFETLLVHNGTVVWWQAHWQRLLNGCERLGIEPPQLDAVLNAIHALCAEQSCVIKIVVTRAESNRGYRPVIGASNCMITRHALPEKAVHSIELIWCETQVSEQADLAGLKHLNRLENVLAQAECQRRGALDGLMCDSQGNVICSSMANVFLYFNGSWQTPALNGSGVAGVARQWFLENVPNVLVKSIRKAHVQNAQAVFICNAVRGMMVVQKIDGQTFPENQVLTELQDQFIHANPAFAEMGCYGI